MYDILTRGLYKIGESEGDPYILWTKERSRE